MHDEREITIRHQHGFLIIVAIISISLVFAYPFILFHYFGSDLIIKFDVGNHSMMALVNIFFYVSPMFLLLIPIKMLMSSLTFTRFRYDDEGMTFLTRPIRLFRISLTFRIPYDEISMVHLTDFSIYRITSTQNMSGNFTVPREFIQYPENEKAFLEALSTLKCWHLDRGNTRTLLELPEHFYSTKKDVQKLRTKNGNVIFSVSGGKYSVWSGGHEY